MIVKVLISDEINKKDIEIKDYQVKSKYSLYELRTSKKKLRDLFETVILQLKEEYNVNEIGSFIVPIELKLIGDFEQKGNYLRLIFKIV